MEREKDGGKVGEERMRREWAGQQGRERECGKTADKKLMGS